MNYPRQCRLLRGKLRVVGTEEDIWALKTHRSVNDLHAGNTFV